MKHLSALILLLCLQGLCPAAPRPFELWPVSNSAQPTAFFKEAPALPKAGKPWRFAAGLSVSAKVDAAQVLRPVTPYQFGCNASWWSGKDWFLDGDRIEKAKAAGLRFWRWPGGSSADNYHWDNDYSRHHQDHEGKDPANMNGSWAVNSDDFIAFCRRSGSEAIVTVNYAAARYADPAYAADLAARWVKFFNVDRKFKVRYWEIGNEVYGNWEEGNKLEGKPQLTGDVYGRDFQVIAAAMRKVDPDICIGAVIVDEDKGDDWAGYHWWMRDLLPQLKGKADYLILHQYFQWPFDAAQNYKEPEPAAILGNIAKVQGSQEAIAGMIDRYAPAEKGIPVALTEYNILNASCPPSIRLINGLFTAEVLGESLKAGYVAADYWDWKNGLDAKLKGDHGLLANGDASAPDNTPRPSYYAFAVFEKAFGDHLLASSSSDPGVKLYASRFAGGEIGLVVVNEGEDNRTLGVELAAFQGKGRLQGWVLSGKDLSGTQALWNGGAGAAPSAGPYPFADLPSYGGLFDPAKALQLSVPARSVSGVVLY